MITVEEYKQLKAFARLDGAVLGMIMCGTFFALIASLTNTAWQMAYMIGIVAVPVFVAYRVRNYRDYEQEAKVGDRIILDGTGILSGFANATKSRSYKVVGRNDDGLLLTKYGCSKRLYVRDYYKDQKVGILTAQEFAALPY